jgi:recombination protein RecR
MIEQCKTISNLLKHLQQVPYLASKNLYRVANYFLSLEPEQVERLCTALREAKYNIEQCALCCVWKEKERPCVYCNDPKRDTSIVCVVETWQDLIAIEKTEAYNGLFHVLGGSICPLEGVGPEDLTIGQFVARIGVQEIKEIILATNQTPEGEATAAYIAHKLQKTDLKVSCLARGIPVGSSLEYMDRLTVFKALSERRPF